ncbi:MAG: 2-succinyl-6-hydroxy-2,4-cyclohexadiene-1-carboxylate synthase [Balneolaceae bacterium]|nr:2-succinyl-6-hydroxy-2,4-cyclohexadiene-1-carboxylate synthase [Balneolaceae bacterium]
MLLYSDSFYYHCTVHQSVDRFPYLLMLHGFMGSHKVFEHLLEDLSSLCNPITIDLAGHGQTESPNEQKYYTAKRQVQQLYSIIQRLKFGNLYLYGYSMGGRLAFQLIASHPELFSGVIIESSHCGMVSKSERTERQALDEKRAHKIEQNFERFIEEWTTLPLFRQTPDEMKLIYNEIMKSQNPKTISASLRGFGAGVMPSVCDKISKLNLPFSLIAGKLDKKYVDRMTEIHKSLNHSNLLVVENAGHRVHADQPEEIIQILKSFVS